MLAPQEHVPQYCTEYAERILNGEDMRQVAGDFHRDHGVENEHFFRLGYFASLLGGDIELDFDWLSIAMEQAQPGRGRGNP